MRLNTFDNIVTAAFFFLLAGIFFLGFLFLVLVEPLDGRAAGIPILLAILCAYAGYRVLWGMRHGE
jgi:hypothetical protein